MESKEWSIQERGEQVKVSYIAKILNVTQPSVVEMLQKLSKANLVDYKKGNLVQMAIKGKKIGKQMIRNTRLLEVLMKDALKMEIDEEMVSYRCPVYLVKTSKKMSSRPCNPTRTMLL